MRYFTVFLFLICSTLVSSQETYITGKVVNDNTLLPLWNINVVNVNLVKAAVTDANGMFTILANSGDTLLISSIGFQSIEVKVTNDWYKNKMNKILLTEKAYALEEVVIPPYSLTGYLEVDSKLIPEKENYWYNISGLTSRYEAGESSPNAFSRIIGSLSNPADALYNFFGKKPKELKKLKELNKDFKIRELLQSKYDRQTIYLMFGINKKELDDILARCSYSEAFIQSANDLQILDAINGCYEEYKVLKK